MTTNPRHARNAGSIWIMDRNGMSYCDDYDDGMRSSDPLSNHNKRIHHAFWDAEAKVEKAVKYKVNECFEILGLRDRKELR